MPMDYERYAQLISYMRDIGLPLPTEYKGSFSRDDLVTAIGFAAFARQDGRAAAEAASAAEAPDRVAALLRAVREIIFPRIGEIVADIVGERADRPALPIACGAGCAHCCHQNVEVTVPEAILAAQALTDPADPRRDAIVATAARLAGLTLLQRNKTGLPCPFLVENQCSI